MKAYRAAGHEVRSAGLVVGSEIDPAKITNPHIRAHALEGRDRGAEIRKAEGVKSRPE